MIPAPAWTPTPAEYHAAPGWSSSMLSVFRRSPRLAYEHYVERSRPRPRPTRAMRVGSIVDARLLGGELQVVEAAKTDGHRDVARARERHPDRLVVCRGEADMADPLIEAVLEPRSESAEVARQLLREIPGHAQYAHRWEERGVPLRLLADRLVEVGAQPTIVELKKTKSPSPGGFARECERYDYVFRAELYRRGLAGLLGAEPGVLFVAVGSEPPHEVGVYTVDSGWLSDAVAEVDEVLDRLRRCLSGGRRWLHDWEAPVGAFPSLRRPRGRRDTTAVDLAADAF